MTNPKTLILMIIITLILMIVVGNMTSMYIDNTYMTGGTNTILTLALIWFYSLYCQMDDEENKNK